MRASTWFCVLMVGLAALAVRVGFAGAEDHPPTHPAPGETTNLVIGEGYHESEDAIAEKRAVDDALDKLAKNLNERFGEHDWNLTAEYLRQHGVNLNVVTVEPVKILPEEPPYRAKEARVELTSKFLGDMQEQVRSERSKTRQFVLARVLVGLVVVLLTVMGYLKLEEATRGYYTLLLRLAVAGILATTVLSLWLIRF
jgi:hypothetical protein